MGLRLHPRGIGDAKRPSQVLHGTAGQGGTQKVGYGIPGERGQLQHMHQPDKSESR
jgi:hypothetical protein